MDVSLREQMTTLKNNEEVASYPFVRRDGGVRARIIVDNPSFDYLLIETVHGRTDPLKRTVTRDYFDNNYWEGAN